MNAPSDQELLRNYVERKSDSAFATLVERYVDLVYSAALRMCGNPHSAKDITQCTFLALSQNARQLTNRSTLAGWLHGTARNLAAKDIRSTVRRRTREQEAVLMNELLTIDSATNWEEIAPHLDAALGELNEPDRDALLLRYFKNEDLRTVGATLGISDDAAQKRVSRAVERLREFFAKRGVTVGTGGLVVVISANAVQAAPVGLALTISTAVVLTGPTLTAAATATATKAIAMTALQKTVITTTIAVLAGVGIYEARQASELRNQLQAIQQQREPFRQEMQQLTADYENATNRLALLQDENSALNRNTSELLRLRGEIGVLRNQNQAASNAQPTTGNPMQFQFPYSPRESWAEKGTQHPFDTILTMFCAVRQFDETRLEQLIQRARESESLEQLTLSKKDWGNILGVQIINVSQAARPGGGQANVEVILEKMETILDKQIRRHEVRKWILTKTNNQWLIIARM